MLRSLSSRVVALVAIVVTSLLGLMPALVDASTQTRELPLGDAPPANRHDRAGRRPLARRQPLGREGQTFRIKVLSLRHLLFYIYDNGHLIAQTDETLSADGKRWTDLIWSPTYSVEKDRLVYRRE